MGKNIALLYMSAYFAQPAPEGSKNRFLRTQTNEAAVSALWKDPASRPDKIVALCSDTVRTKPTVPAADGSGNKVPTLEYFRDEFLKQLGVQPEQLVAVSVPDSMEEADQTRAISAVLEQVAENDNLYIDLSGGMRDTATLLLIVARYLKDIRMVQTKKVLYSELKGNSSVVRDSTVKFQKDTGLLPLSTSAIEQTLGDVAFYLFKLKECKATAPAGIELLDSNKAF